MKELRPVGMLLSLAITACGGDYSSPGSDEQWVERECIDWNDNLQCDQNENTGVSAASTSSASAVRLLEEVSSSTGQQRTVLLAPLDVEYVDGLTSLLWNEVANNPFVNTSEAAKTYLTERLALNWNRGSDVYTQQEAVVRRRLQEAQQAIADPKLAIAALAETLLSERQLDVAVDTQQVPSDSQAVALLARVNMADGITSWDYSAVRQQLVVATEARHLRVYDSRNGFALTDDKELASGTEVNAASAAQVAEINAQLTEPVDAFAAATGTPTPPPVPVPPTEPTNPTTPTNPTPVNRDLEPMGTIKEISLGTNFSYAYVLTQQDEAPVMARACNTSDTNYGIFKVNLFADKAEVVGGCNQGNLTSLQVHDDGGNILVFDQQTRRIYWVSKNTMREASNYYLTLTSELTHLSANPSDDYALVSESTGQQSYLVRLADMLVMSQFGMPGYELKASRWVNGGDELMLLSNRSWQRWDMRVASAPRLIESGSIRSTLSAGTLTSVSENGVYYTRLGSAGLSIYRMDDHTEVAQLAGVEDMFWQANDLIVKDASGFARYQLHRDVTNDLQQAAVYLSDARIAANNPSLTSVSQSLNLPQTVPGTDLSIRWSGDLQQLSYSGANIGQLSNPVNAESGVITATINSSFRGDAVRWRKDFNVQIKPVTP